MSNQNFIKIGKITKHHGIKGEAKLYYTGNLREFNYKEVFLKQRGKLLSYFIESFRFHKNFVLLKLKGIDSIDDVNKFLKGREVFVNIEQLPELPEDEYYWYQLIGLKVYDINKNFIGTVKDLIETGSNDVLIVTNKGKETLIPFIEDAIIDINLDEKKVIVELFEEV